MLRIEFDLVSSFHFQCQDRQMSEIKQLSPCLRPLEIFGLQYFSLSRLKFKSSLKFASKNSLIYFLCYIFIYIGLAYLNEVLSAEERNKIRLKIGADDIFFNTIVIVLPILAFFRTLIALTEPLFKAIGNQKFFVILNEFQEFLVTQLDVKITFKNFKKILNQRLLILCGFLAFQHLFLIYKLIVNFSFNLLMKNLYMSFQIITVFLILYKICFYVDLIYICLKTFHDTIDQIPVYNQDDKILVKKIYRMMRAYIYIIEISAEFNGFIAGTIGSYMALQILYISWRVYKQFKHIGAWNGNELKKNFTRGHSQMKSEINGHFSKKKNNNKILRKPVLDLKPPPPPILDVICERKFKGNGNLKFIYF